MQSPSSAVSFGSLVLPRHSTISGHDLARRAAALSVTLQRLGLSAGDRLAIATADSAAFYTTFAAAMASGLTAVIIDPLAAAAEIGRMLARSTPAAAVVDAAVANAATTAGDPITVPTVLVGGPGESGRSGRWLPWRRTDRAGKAVSFDDAVQGEFELEWRHVEPDRAAYVMFTSGSTSTPKGVVISRQALFTHVRTLSQVFGYGPGSALLHYLPLHHTDGLVHGPAAAILTGMDVVAPGAFSPQSAETLPALLRAHRVTHFLAVPTILSMVHRIHGDRADLFDTEWFRHAISTAGYLHEELWQGFEAAFGLRLSNFYGMTETVSGSLYCGPSDATYRRGTLGKPVDCSVRIVGENGARTPPDEVGRLEISGSHLLDGYLSDPQATAAVLRDGWLDTGDLFRVDSDGFYVFAGRHKTVIKRGGITVYPEDVRRPLEALAWVREVEVIGVPDPTFEQIVVVCAVLDAGRTAADVHAECARQLAPERRPDRVILMSSLPRGASGKVRREVLLEQAAQPQREIAGDDSIAGQVQTIAAQIFQVDAATLGNDTTPDDVPNWDSYAQIELAMALEKRFDLRLTPKELMQLRSLGHAVEILTRRLTAVRR